MTSEAGARAPLVDALEMGGVLILPALLLGVVAGVFGGTQSALQGVFVGGLFGAILAGLRRGFYAVRTDDGIERRLRFAREDGPWRRLAAIEYDRRYDRLLAVCLLLIGVGGFAAVPILDPGNGALTIRLILLGLFGLVSALLVIGSLDG